MWKQEMEVCSLVDDVPDDVPAVTAAWQIAAAVVCVHYCGRLSFASPFGIP